MVVACNDAGRALADPGLSSQADLDGGSVSQCAKSERRWTMSSSERVGLYRHER
jgi:hypothetical protein